MKIVGKVKKNQTLFTGGRFHRPDFGRETLLKDLNRGTKTAWVASNGSKLKFKTDTPSFCFTLYYLKPRNQQSTTQLRNRYSVSLVCLHWSKDNITKNFGNLKIIKVIRQIKFPAVLSVSIYSSKRDINWNLETSVETVYLV